MAKITIENLFGKIVQADTQKTLLQNFQDHRVDWMHACGGKGRCTTCRIIIKYGAEHFSPLTVSETRFRHHHSLADNERLTCQSRITGDVSVVVPQDCQLPHIHYGTAS